MQRTVTETLDLNIAPSWCQVHPVHSGQSQFISNWSTNLETLYIRWLPEAKIVSTDSFLDNMCACVCVNAHTCMHLCAPHSASMLHDRGQLYMIALVVLNYSINYNNIMAVEGPNGIMLAS